MATLAIDASGMPPRDRASRRRTWVRGSLESTTSRARVILRNVSTSGALVEGAGLPPPGRDVVLDAGGVSAFATVVWTEGDRCGLSFDEPIPQHQVIELHRQVPDYEEENRTLWSAARTWACGA